jgi:peptidoglycan hydrolase CwlO-like protein
VNVNFLFWDINLPQGVVIIIAAAFGAITVFLLSVVKRLQIGAAIRSDKRTIANLEEEKRTLQSKLEEVNKKVADLIVRAEKAETEKAEAEKAEAVRPMNQEAPAGKADVR